MVQSRTQALNASEPPSSAVWPLICSTFIITWLMTTPWLTHHVQHLPVSTCTAGWRCGTFLVLPLLPNSGDVHSQEKPASATSTIWMPVSELARPAKQHPGNVILPLATQPRPALVTLNSNESEHSDGLCLSSWGMKWESGGREWARAWRVEGAAGITWADLKWCAGAAKLL